MGLLPYVSLFVSPGSLRVAGKSMDKYDTFGLAEHTESPLYRRLLQICFVRLDYNCQSCRRDRLMTAWDARRGHNVLFVVERVSRSRKAVVIKFTSSITPIQAERKALYSYPRTK